MGVKVLRRRELTFWEELYIPQIISGLRITSVHFFRNLFLHAAHSVGMLKHLAASATFQYPEEPRPLARRFRSRHRLTVREEGHSALRRLHAVRDRLPGKVHHHRCR